MNRSITLTNSAQERFLRSFIKEENDKCWNWIAEKTDRGYGIFRFQKLHIRAHRLSWFLNFGEIKEGLSVLHKCDNRTCVNPSHLFLGTQKDNMDDMHRKERGAYGEKHGKAKLNNEKVAEIKNLLEKGTPQKEISQKFGISRRLISFIKLGQRWSHINK